MGLTGLAVADNFRAPHLPGTVRHVVNSPRVGRFGRTFDHRPPVCSDFSQPSAFQHGPFDSSQHELANGVLGRTAREVSPTGQHRAAMAGVPAVRQCGRERHIAKRSSELNAKWMPALGVAAGAIWMAACLVSTACARTGTARPRSDVDKLLVQAHAAIEEGNLDRAAALVERAESAQPRYPLFHMGPTPALGAPRVDAGRARWRQTPGCDSTELAEA